MEAIVLDLEKAKFLVDQAIKQKGEGYVYEQQNGSCLYVHPSCEEDDEGFQVGRADFENGTPGCLVGLAFIKAGVPLEEFRRKNDEGAVDLVSDFEQKGIVTDVTDEAKLYLYMVQTTQDNGYTWGEAQRQANKGYYITVQGDRASVSLEDVL